MTNVVQALKNRKKVKTFKNAASHVTGADALDQSQSRWPDEFRKFTVFIKLTDATRASLKRLAERPVDFPGVSEIKF